MHRDVKPGNILLKWNEAGFSDIELADLGCARMMPVPERRRFNTKTEVDLHGAALSRQEGLTPHVCTLAYATTYYYTYSGLPLIHFFSYLKK